MGRGNVTIAHDDRMIRIVLNQALARAGFAPRFAENHESLWTSIKRGESDVILIDNGRLFGETLEVVERIRKLRPNLPFIILSAENPLMASRAAVQIGALDFLATPIDIEDLISVVTRSISETRSSNSLSQAVSAEEAPFIGRSRLMRDVCSTLARLSQSDLTVMITGESGTGKQTAAHALHEFGKRRFGPFIAIDIAAVPHNQVEELLFGPLTPDAIDGTHGGYFAKAAGGSIFFNRIDEMPLKVQKRLSNLLTQTEYASRNSTNGINSRVRIIAATQFDLNEKIKQGFFSEDLFYRLNVAPIRLPPLREHIEDIGDLTHQFLRRVAREGLGVKSIDGSALERLKAHSWPGNIRELENLIRRLTILSPKHLINSQAVDRELTSRCAPASQEVISTTELGLSELVQRYLLKYFSSFGDALPPPGLRERITRSVEKPLLSVALAATRGNQVRAAEILGVNRNTLRKRMLELEIPDSLGAVLTRASKPGDKNDQTYEEG